MSDGPRPGRRVALPLVVAAALLAGSVAAAPPAAAQDTLAAARDTVGAGAPGDAAFFGRSYALLAHDPATGHLGLIAASTEFSVGSGGAYLEPGSGAVVAQGHGANGAGRRVLEALRSGLSPAAALSSVPGPRRPAQSAALTPACDRAAQPAPWAAEEAVRRPGRSGGVCYVAVGLRLRGPARLDPLVRAFRSSRGGLRERLLAAASAMERSARPVGGSRSAVLWVATTDTARPVLGRRELRLQVEDHERPTLALEKRLEAGRAEWLARRSARSIARGAYRRAASLADSSLALDVSAPMAWMQRGRALLYRGRVEEAEEAFRRMLELDPYLLGLLGSASGSEISVRESLIPYYPRLVLRLELYRRKYFDDLDFGPEPRPFVSDSTP